jgi:hypothetical protein
MTGRFHSFQSLHRGSLTPKFLPLYFLMFSTLCELECLEWDATASLDKRLRFKKGGNINLL